MRYDWPVVNLSFRLKGNSKCTCSHFIGSEGGCGGGGGGGVQSKGLGTDLQTSLPGARLHL